MTEKRFITNDPYGYSRIFYDGSRLDNKKVCKKLNTLTKENEELKEAREYYQENFLTMKTERNQFKRENELLKFQLDECRNNKLFSRRELEKENEQLQKSLSASVEKNRKLQRILDKLGYEYIGDLK